MNETKMTKVSQRSLGKTGLKIPELILGGGFVGGVMIHSDKDTRAEAIRRCCAVGSDWIDTAHSYGNGESEKNIGDVLAMMPKDQRPRVSTKIALGPDDLRDVKGAVRKAIEASLARLKLDKVEVYQLHNRIGAGDSSWLSPYQILKPGGVADAFQAVKDAGLTDHIGITALGEPNAVRDIIASERFETAQVYYNLLNPSSGKNVGPNFGTTDFRGLLGACQRHGLGVFGIRILAAGVLATKERHGREIPITENSEPDTEASRANAAWKTLGPRNEEHAVTAIRYALAEKKISTAVFGAATLEHIDIALSAAIAGPLEAAAVTKLDSLH
jgi:D-threo-aldose 1-dehydrogenase